jgi:aryl-alcohol dehydrogenase-like predicted oxidoreductase
MRKTFFGRTGLDISELAFGGGVTGGILINPDEATRYNALRRAVAATRVLGITRIEQLNEALEALARGPLPTPAVSKLDALWANEFAPG